jgi:hypothetical protein
MGKYNHIAQGQQRQIKRLRGKWCVSGHGDTLKICLTNMVNQSRISSQVHYEKTGFWKNNESDTKSQPVEGLTG